MGRMLPGTFCHWLNECLLGFVCPGWIGSVAQPDDSCHLQPRNTTALPFRLKLLSVLCQKQRNRPGAALLAHSSARCHDLCQSTYIGLPSEHCCHSLLADNTLFCQFQAHRCVPFRHTALHRSTPANRHSIADPANDSRMWQIRR